MGEPGPPLPKSRVGTRPLAPFVPPSMEYHLQSAISYHLLFLRKITSTWIKHASKIITNAIRDKLSFLIFQYIFSKSIDTCMQSLMRFWCLFVSERRQCFDVTKLNSTHREPIQQWARVLHKSHWPTQTQPVAGIELRTQWLRDQCHIQYSQVKISCLGWGGTFWEKCP